MASVFPICNFLNKNTILTHAFKNGFIFSRQVIKFCTSEPQVSTDHRNQRDQEGLPKALLPSHENRPWQAKLNRGDSVVSFSRGKRKKKKSLLLKLVSEGLTHIVYLSKSPKTLPPSKKENSKSYVNSGGIRRWSGLRPLPTFAGTVNTIKIKGLQSDQSSSIGMSRQLAGSKQEPNSAFKRFCLPNVRNKHKTFYHVTFMTLRREQSPCP